MSDGHDEARGRALRPLTIVMYHYVRPLARSRFPAIKALDLDLFREQLAFLKRHYTIVAMDDVLAALEGTRLPDRACLLSFDDGYADHFRYVFPLLRLNKVSGAFFPPCASLLDRTMLDVNKIHHVLASETDKAKLEASLDTVLVEREGHDAASLAALKARYRVGDHLDTPDVVYVKHLLQYALPDAVRARVVDALFARYVSGDATGFAEELYFSADEARAMIGCGMHVGGHGDSHRWMTRVVPEERSREIARTRTMLLDLGMRRDALTFCHPYGDNDADGNRALADAGFRVALSTATGVADLARDPMALARLDTIDLPRAADALPNGWTEYA